MILVLSTFLFVVGTAFLYGLVQMGDCYPEEPIYGRCLADQARIGRNVLIVAAAVYAPVVWLLVRRRKKP